MKSEDPTASVEAFLKVADQFKLGDLPTEQSHPLTQNLSQLSRENLPRALQTMKQVDEEALRSFKDFKSRLFPLQKQIADVLGRGKRVFLCGCGATGRLALSLEYIWRQVHPASDAVVSFMAGGDVALVHALEGFEDHPDRGARQLEQAGFSQGDMLICCTEGGETPFVIGAALHAVTLSKEPVYFLFCNPQSLLQAKLHRCREVMTNPSVHSLELCVGPMALCGSTRMQASTVLMLAVGLALLSSSADELNENFDEFFDEFSRLPYEDLQPLTEAESECYAKNERLVYSVKGLAIAAFTDTTERAPTFSLRAFQPEGDLAAGETPSWSFVECQNTEHALEAWQHILGRSPRPLDWSEVHPKSTDNYLSRFDFSRGARERRKRRWPEFKFNLLDVTFHDRVLQFELGLLRTSFQFKTRHPLFHHLLLKLLLNTHSTLVMGRCGRFEGNWMTYVMPTNAKLIDRASRYVLGLLARDHVNVSYERVIQEIFATQAESLKKQSPLVLDVYEVLKRKV